MLFNNLPFIMVMGFLLLTLALGLYYSRKITTLREYAIGNKDFTTATLVATTLATSFGGGGLLRTVEQTYEKGLYWILFGLSGSIGYWLLSPLLLRMGPFMQHLSLAETIGSVYGNKPKFVVALSSIISEILVIAMQVIAIKTAINICIDLSFSDHAKMIEDTVTVIVTFILIIYSISGGIRSVTLTDVLQFITFTAIIPLVAWFVFKATNQSMVKIASILHKEPKFQLDSCLHVDKLLSLAALFLANLASFADPTTVQRIYMASSPIQARKSFLYSGTFDMVITGFITLIALFLFVKTPILSRDQIWPHIFQSIPAIFKGLIAISLLAMAMSTADSSLNACAVLISHDVIGNIKTIKITTNRYKLGLTRLSSLIVGICAVLLAFRKRDLLSLMLLALDFSVPIITAPFLLAVCGFRGSSRTALMGMATGVLAILAWNQWIEPTTGIDGAFPCMLANGLAMLIAHYLLPQPAGTGWVKPDDSYTAYKQRKNYAAKLRKESLRAVFAHPRAYLTALKPSDITLIGTGFYIIINGFISFIYNWNAGCYLGSITLFLLGISLVSYVLFLKKHPIPDWIITLCFWLALLCALPIHSLCSWFRLPHPLLTLALSCTHIVLLLFLLPRYVALFMAMPLFCLYVCCCYKIALLWPSAQLFLPLLGSGILLFGFMLYVKHRLDKLVAQRKLLELRSAYEQRVALEAIYNQAHLARLDAYTGNHLLTEMGKTLQETTESLNKTSDINKEINLFLKKLNKVGYTWLERENAERNMALNPKDITSVDITSTIVKICGYIQTLDSSIQFFLRNQSSTTYLEADSALLECLVMLNIWELSKSRLGAHQELTLTLADTTLHYGQEFTDTTDSSDVTALILPAVAFSFSTERTTPEIQASYTVVHTAAYKVLPKTEEYFYQLESRQIVEAHGGYTEIIETADHLTCLYVLPVKGKQVMHLKTYDSADLVAAKVAETEESIAQEQELISLLTSNSTLTQEKVTQAIAFIKNAHGLVRRKSGAPYYTHPMEVAKILLEVTADPDTILAGLLHDVVEDTPITLHQITMLYGEAVALMVDKVTEYNTHGYPWKLGKIEQNSILDVCGDIRVVQVKLADRLHNMRTLYARKPKSQQRIARETLTFYIPWGERNKGPEAWLMEMRQICEKIIK